MPNYFDTGGSHPAVEVRSILNEDGTITYKATLENLPVTWFSSTTWDCVGKVEITIDAPEGMPVPGSGNLFRFADNGGYAVHISGTDWS